MFGNVNFSQSGNWDYVGGKKNITYYIDIETIEYDNSKGDYKVRQIIVNHKKKVTTYFLQYIIFICVIR